ncbi:uncharacterized protein DSM5745_11379 [Aspergillus mulundensis]|uniref:Uncharacterized protein n=1 Tax=Aspergillus mulundensis TaxID=1810919 RepID=A0A3D8Q7S3_9EURO|nr:hypothetical protein DSM5745_11379 [Aspergillus mulundensis]RDW57861.1 hypothetical protein DSM5745_11379 [Aspergillus mulundensis]
MTTLHPPKHAHPSSSTTQVPTVHTLQYFKRSLSYTIAESPIDQHEHGPDPSHTTLQAKSPVGQKLDEAGCNQMMKASLTGLLNCQEVKNEARERKVQNMLMDTERDLRRARRASLKMGGALGKKGSTATATATPDITAALKTGDGNKGDK